MWIIEIRFSTVIVHCVEPSVIVNQNVLRDFSTQEKGGTNERLTTGEKKKKTKKKKDKNMTQHERAFIVLCIYAIVYVWIWRIWKYMLTNLYRVFYVMWNTWSRCSLLSLALLLFLFCLLFILFFFFLSKTEHIRRTRLTLLTGFLDSQGRTCSYLRRWIPSENASWVKVVMTERNIVVLLHSCWLKHRKGGR